MKSAINIKIKGLSLLMVLVSLLGVINVASAQDSTTKSYIKVHVDGLSCPFCAYGLERNIKKSTRAEEVFISVEDGFMTFIVPKDDPPTEDELRKIVKNSGFTAREISFSDKPFNQDDK